VLDGGMAQMVEHLPSKHTAQAKPQYCKAKNKKPQKTLGVRKIILKSNKPPPLPFPTRF
jgi:hypothetical protein